MGGEGLPRFACPGQRSNIPQMFDRRSSDDSLLPVRVPLPIFIQKKYPQGYLFCMGGEGLEPSRVAPLASKANAVTSFATRPKLL